MLNITSIDVNLLLGGRRESTGVKARWDGDIFHPQLASPNDMIYSPDTLKCIKFDFILGFTLHHRHR